MIYIVCRRSTAPVKYEKFTNQGSEPCRIPVCAMRNHKRLGYQVKVLDPETHTPYDKAMWGDDDVWLHISKANNYRNMSGLKLPQLDVGQVVEL